MLDGSRHIMFNIVCSRFLPPLPSPLCCGPRLNRLALLADVRAAMQAGRADRDIAGMIDQAKLTDQLEDALSSIGGMEAARYADAGGGVLVKGRTVQTDRDRRLADQQDIE